MRIKTFTQQLNEKKDHIINKLPLLSKEQKEEVIAFFNKKPNLERKIDWNKGLRLAWDDFVDVMREVSKTEREKKVKQHGIAGLKEGTDYVELKVNSSLYQAYIPLHWEASKLIASNKIGGCTGEWCISYQKDISYWKSYTQKKKQLPIYVVGAHAKWSVMVHENDRDFDVWDHYDTQVDEEDIEGLNIMRDLIRPNEHIFDKLRQEHFKFKHFIELAVIEDAKYYIDEHGFLIWESGKWNKGEWDDGHWISGSWNAGIWNKGMWKGGTWYSGVWKDGNWHDGYWQGGTWEDGLWENGEWSTGQWKDGTWYGGTWNAGIWITGTWKAGKWMGGIWKGGAFISGDWYKGIWNEGMWMDGTWHGGQWRGGYWRHGEWLGGEWLDGTWANGVWHEGDWYKGTWEDGDWNAGNWLEGEWKNGWWKSGVFNGGVWHDGTWNGGTWVTGFWKKGNWLGGYDSKGGWHGKGDSPDKWS